MASRNFHYRWQWQLKSTPEQLWPYVADTNRYNRDVKIPSIQRREQAGGRLPNARQPLRLILFGLRVEWDEEPFEWVWPQGFSVIRRYKTGPIAELRGKIQLRPLNGGGTELTVEANARPANLLGHVVIPLQIGMISGRKADKVYRRYDQLAQARDAFSAVQPKQLKFVPGGEQRLAQFAKQLQEDGASATLISLLVGTVQEGDQIALSRMRPYALADAWDQPRREVLELCLMATRVGMLQFRWELLCPLCRGPKQTATSLGEIGAEVHCDACNIDFSVNFDRSVELMFQPTPSVRDIEERPYCMGGPQLTPHIIAQKLISSGESVIWQPALEAGRYRLRALELPGSQSLSIQAGGRNALALQIRDGWNDDEPEVALQPTISVENKTDGEQLFVLERAAWTDDAATAAEVTVLQRFRDLFSNEALRPGERISVGSLTILFTDLRGSTQLYRSVGDAPAFGRVMDHFEVLKKVIDDQQGALIKTIGDAVMAAFRRPVNALRAVLKAQILLKSAQLGLKAGLHSGPCIAVTLNERLDYFGSSVNIAARLVDLSDGSDVVISQVIRDDPEVAAMLADPKAELQSQPLESTLKGFGDDRFSLWQVKSG